MAGTVESYELPGGNSPGQNKRARAFMVDESTGSRAHGLPRSAASARRSKHTFDPSSKLQDVDSRNTIIRWLINGNGTDASRFQMAAGSSAPKSLR
jgi:hypothetical protein